MRRWLLTGMAVVAATMTVLPVAAASATPAAKHDVLTISKVDGPGVKAKAVLKASLKPKTAAAFSTSIGVLKCTQSTVTQKVTKNPTAPGVAQLSLTAQTFGKCSISSFKGATVTVKLNKLPYLVTISDKTKSDPVTVANPRVSFVANISGIGSVSCAYTASSKAKSIIGHASNKTHLITFSKQGFTVAAGSNGLCPKSGDFAAAYGPLKDTSVVHSPTVYVS